MTHQQLALAVLLGSLVIPTAAYIAERQSTRCQRPAAAKVAGWLGMWVGQLAIPMGLIAWRCVRLALAWGASGAVTAALVYGVAMAIVAAYVTTLAWRTFALGMIALRPATDDALAVRAKALVGPAAAAFAMIAVYVFGVMRFVPMPGREWMPLVYLGFVLVPIGLTTSLILIITSALSRPPWREPPAA